MSEPFEVTFRGRHDAREDWQRRAFPTHAQAAAFADGLSYGDEPAYRVLNIVPESEPRCDLCGCTEDHEPGLIEYDWNGETGNHLSCERED